MNNLNVYIEQLKLSNMDQVNEIMNNLYLGNMLCAMNRDFFSNNNVKLVIHCTKDFEIPLWYPEYGIRAIRLPINDSNTESDNAILQEQINDILEIIHEYRKKNLGVLIHCYAGVSRSATVTCCYLIRYYKYNTDTGIFYIQYKRPVTFKPYANFENFLRFFEKKEINYNFSF